MKTGLIVVDIQNDYFPGGAVELPGMDEAAKKAKSGDTKSGSERSFAKNATKAGNNTSTTAAIKITIPVNSTMIRPCKRWKKNDRPRRTP